MSTKNNISLIVLICIVVIACIVRVWKVTSDPPALSWDEVSIGYNAYSILKTGKDEHGRFMPLDTFVGYGDYKPPVAIYLTVPFVAIFGLNELAVRLPSVLFGTATVLLVYFLVRELFRSWQEASKVALISAAVLALSPWHIQISRAGFEANIALFFIVLGVIFVLKALTRPKIWLYAWVPFVGAIYTFNSSRYVAPLLGVLLLIYARKAIMKQKKYFSIGVVFCIILLLPIIPHLTSKEARLRFAEVNIFSDISIVIEANQRSATDGNTWWSGIVHNRRWGYLRAYVVHYLDNFEPWFLFLRGDGNPKFSSQSVGQMYLFEAIFLFIGLYWMFRIYPTQAKLLTSWLVLAIIPAAVARETPHALRILNSLPVWQIFVAFGIYTVIMQCKKYRNIVFIGISTCYVFGFTYFYHDYLIYYPVTYSAEWQWGYREALHALKTKGTQSDPVVMADDIGRPYMYTLFYSKYDPATYLSEKKSYFDAAGFYQVQSFGRYTFVRGAPTELKPNVTYIVNPSHKPEGAKDIDTIKLLNGEPVLSVFQI